MSQTGYAMVGVSSLSIYKQRIFSVTATFSALALIFAITMACALDSHQSTIERVHWTFGKGSSSVVQVKVFAGISGYIASVTMAGKTTKTTILYEDSDKCPQDFCDRCEEIFVPVTATCIIGIVAVTSSLLVQFTRGFGKDSSKLKLTGVIISLAAVCSFLASLLIFYRGCVRYFPEKVPFEKIGTHMTYKLGPSAVLGIIVMSVELLVLLIHLIVPVPLGYLNEALIK